MSTMTSHTRAYFAAAILTLALATQASSASAQDIGAGQIPGAKASARNVQRISCTNLPLTEVVQNDSSQSTASSSFIDVIGSDVSFNVSGTGPSCVIVSFSAQAFAPGIFTAMRVRARLDDQTSVEGEIQLIGESSEASEAHAYNFVFRQVFPGPHRFVMQYRAVNPTTTVAINDFNLGIRHR